jgi:hypothetical protein
MPGGKTIHYIRAGVYPVFQENIFHGTCIASKIAGPVLGTAKNVAHTVMIVLPSKLWGSDVLEALIYINDYVDGNNLKGKAVVNMSIHCKFNTLV